VGLVWLVATAAGAQGQGRLDLQALFAPPTQLELDAVRNDWSARPLVVDGFRVETSFREPLSGARFDVISHLVEGERHYGGIRYPLSYTSGAKYPVMVACHGGTAGAVLETVANLMVPFPNLCVSNEFFLIVPSFRGEALGTFSAGTFQSEGEQSWADRDVDDTMALLSAALEYEPDMDRARIAAWGISRGASVALFLGVRDERIRRIVDMFGFTDLSLPSVVSEIDAIVNHGLVADGIAPLVVDTIIKPLLRRQLTVAEARMSWIRRSVRHFIATVPPFQAHHGMLDTQVDASHTQALLDTVAFVGLGDDYAEAYYYPTGQHGLNTMPGHGAIVEPYLCRLNDGPSGFCGPMTQHVGGGFAGFDYGGAPMLGQSNFRLRVHNAPPMGAGLFFVSPSTGYLANGAGFLCLGAGLQRVGIGLSNASGYVDFPLNVANIPAAAQSLIGPGSTVYFQFVFRDNGNPSGDWNQSNGLAVTFNQ